MTHNNCRVGFSGSLPADTYLPLLELVILERDGVKRRSNIGRSCLSVTAMDIGLYNTTRGPINDFLGTEVVVDFPPETESRVENQTTTKVPRKSYRPKCGINFYHTSYKILVESVTL